MNVLLQIVLRCGCLLLLTVPPLRAMTPSLPIPYTTVHGTAADAKSGAAIIEDNGRVIYLDGLPAWPPAQRGKQMRVRGQLQISRAESLHDEQGQYRAGVAEPQQQLLDVLVLDNRQDCFSAAHFQQVRRYVEDRLDRSGMGKFYLEFPPPPATTDGRKRPPQNLQLVYDINVDPRSRLLLLRQGPQIIYIHPSQGLQLDQHATADLLRADAVFCHLLRQAQQHTP